MTRLTTPLFAALIAFGVLGAPAAKADDVTVGFGIANGEAFIAVEDGRRGPRHGRGSDDPAWGDEDGRRGGYGRLSPREIRFMLRERGFHDIRFTDRDGRFYRALATGPRGRPVALRISARSGEIVDIERVGRRHRGWEGRGWDDRGW